MAYRGRRQSIAVLPSFIENSGRRLDHAQKPDQQKVVGRRTSLTFKEWSQQVETREKLKQARVEKERHEEEERDMLLSEQKFKRRMSFQQWMEAKSKPADETRAEIEPTSEEDDHQEKSDRAFQKWLLQKEKQKLENEERLLDEERIRRKKLEEKLQAVAEKNKLGRRASII